MDYPDQLPTVRLSDYRSIFNTSVSETHTVKKDGRERRSWSKEYDPDSSSHRLQRPYFTHYSVSDIIKLLDITNTKERMDTIWITD